MTPQLRFPEFSGEWRVKKLGDVVKLRKKKFDPQKSTESRKDIELDNLSSETGQIIDFVDSKTQKSIKSVFQKNDILYGKLRPYLKKFAKAPWDGVSSSEIWAMYSSELDSNLLLQLVQTKTFNDSVNIQSGSKMPRADWGLVSDTEYAIPQKPEQEKIAEFLTAVDSRIAAGERKLASLTQYKKAVMQQIFSQQIRFKDENGNPYPEWQEKRLGGITDFVNGYTFLSSTYVDGGKYKVITIANVQQGALSADGANRVSSLPSSIQPSQILGLGDILISMTGNVGRVCLVNEENCLLNQRVGKIVPKNVDKDYLYHYLNNPHFVARMVSSGQGGAQDNLSSRDIKNYILSIPCVEEQQKIATFLTTLDARITAETTRLASAKEWKKGLLQRMFV